MWDFVLIYLIIGMLLATGITVQWRNNGYGFREWYYELTIFLTHVVFWPAWLVMVIFIWLDAYISNR